jgi:hypothetical protein
MRGCYEEKIMADSEEHTGSNRIGNSAVVNSKDDADEKFKVWVHIPDCGVNEVI